MQVENFNTLHDVLSWLKAARAEIKKLIEEIDESLLDCQKLRLAANLGLAKDVYVTPEGEVVELENMRNHAESEADSLRRHLAKLDRVEAVVYIFGQLERKKVGPGFHEGKYIADKDVFVRFKAFLKQHRHKVHNA